MSDADDVLKQASRLFSRLGGQVKETSKQVTGLGRGEVRLELVGTRATPGGALRGTVHLSLTEPVEGKRLVVALRAHQRMIELGRTSAAATRTEVFRFEQELGGTKRYEAGAVAFELPVPVDALDKRPAAGGHPLADVARTVASVIKPTVGPIEWSVQARLEIAWGRDLTREVDVTIAP
jgi:hypothetical protein